MSNTETQESSNGKGSRSSLWEISSELVGTRHFRPIRLIPRQKPLYDYMCIYIPETQDYLKRSFACWYLRTDTILWRA